jgi:hypothetical protein
MNEYVKGLMKAVQMTRADLETAQREHDAAVQELLGELDKEARGEAPTKKGESEQEKKGGEVGPHTHARDSQGTPTYYWSGYHYLSP